MQITFTALNIDDLRAQMWTFLNGPGHVAPAAPVFKPPQMVKDAQGREMPVVPAWAPRGSLWVGTAYGPKLIAPDGTEVSVNWMDFDNKPTPETSGGVQV